MKYLLVLVMVFCQSCILVSDAKYKADEAMWQAKAEASKAWADKSSQPLATFTAVSGETFTVTNPIQAKPMPVIGEPNAIVQGADVVLNSGVAKILGGGWAAGYMLGKVQGNNIASGEGTINVTRDSGNPIAVDTGDRPDSSVVTTDSHDATATPTIIEQPAPVIVPSADPVIVRPEIVKPVVVGGDE